VFTVTPHQDGTFLNNDPLKLVGYWFPIDDATLENGCLWYVPGSHKYPITRRYIRNQADNPESLMIFEGEDPTANDEEWIAAPVKKGTFLPTSSKSSKGLLFTLLLLLLFLL
jgi:phytanoyl-CoA hydroxylase